MIKQIISTPTLFLKIAELVTIAVNKDHQKQIDYCIEKGILQADIMHALKIYVQYMPNTKNINTMNTILNAIKNEEITLSTMLNSCITLTRPIPSYLFSLIPEHLNNYDRVDLLSKAKEYKYKLLGKTIINFNQNLQLMKGKNLDQIGSKINLPIELLIKIASYLPPENKTEDTTQKQKKQ